MTQPVSLQARVAFVSALAAAIVIAAIGVAFVVFLRINGADQLDRTLQSVMIASPASTDGQVAETVPAAPAQALPEQDAASQIAVRTESDTTGIVLSRDVTVAGDGSVVQVSIPEDPLTAAIRRQQVQVAVAAAAAIAVAAGLGWILAGRAVRPLQRLAAATHTVGDDPHAERPHEGGIREAEELSTAIGQMLDRIASAQRRTEEALQSARDFAAVSAHELRTPLTSMRTDLEVLATLPLTREEHEEILHDLLSTQRQVETTLTDLERLAIGELADPADHEDLDLVELVDRCVQEARREHPGVEVTLTAPDIIMVRGITTGLRLVVENAITNAVRHGDARRIRVGVAADMNGSVLLSVDDDGTGIPAPDRERVVERFVRGSTTSADGSGLGLALIAQQAALHGGTVTLTDSPLGGERLEIQLPGVRLG